MIKIKNIGLLLLLSFNFVQLYSQNNDCMKEFDQRENDTVYVKVTESPQYVGTQSLLYLLKNEITISQEDILESKIYVEFVVGVDGFLSNVRIRGKQNSDYTKLECDIVAFFKSLPKWKPGRCNGTTVRTKVYYPIILN